jgi:hypothetical protein
MITDQKVNARLECLFDWLQQMICVLGATPSLITRACTLLARFLNCKRLDESL